MSDSTGIEWTDATWNPIVGCSIVSPGCTNCYAMRMAARIIAMAGTRDVGVHYDKTVQYHVSGRPVWTGHVATAPDRILTAPLHWKKSRRIFVNSMGDLFHESIPDDWIDRVFAVMALCPQHTFQVLTKRAERMREYVSKGGSERSDQIWKAQFDVKPAYGHAAYDWPLSNVWLGVSAERQQEAAERIPLLLQTPAAIRFVSLEPLLGPIQIWGYLGNLGWQMSPGDVRTLDWIIVGGESGPNARPMNPQWARDIRDECKKAGVAFFHKQNGEYASVSEVEGDGKHFQFPDGRTVRRVGKKAAGRRLDHVEHSAFPEVRT